MDVLKPPSPTVFKDKIPPNEAPAQMQGPTKPGGDRLMESKLKMDFVKEAAPQRIEKLEEAAKTQPTKEEAQESTRQAETGLTEAEQKLKETAEQAKRAASFRDVPENAISDAAAGLLHKVGLAKGTRTLDERTSQIAQTEIAARAAQAKKDQAKAEVVQAKVNQETVQMYDRDYLAREIGVARRQLETALKTLAALEDEKVEYSPMLMVSREMSEALDIQDATQLHLRLSERYGTGSSSERMLPANVFAQALSQAREEIATIRAGGYGTEKYRKINDWVNRAPHVRISDGERSDMHMRMSSYGEEILRRIHGRAERAILTQDTVMGAGVDYAIEHSFIDPKDATAVEALRNKMAEFAQSGATLYEDESQTKLTQVAGYAKKVLGPENTNDFILTDPYVRGCMAMEELFAKDNIPTGEARVPLVLAFSAGFNAKYEPTFSSVNSGGGIRSAKGDLALAWLSDVLPSNDHLEAVNENGKWVVKNTGKEESFGLGHSRVKKVKMEEARISTQVAAEMAKSSGWDKYYEAEKKEDALKNEGHDTVLEAARILTRINHKNFKNGLMEYITIEKADPELAGFNLPGNIVVELSESKTP